MFTDIIKIKSANVNDFLQFLYTKKYKLYL